VAQGETDHRLDQLVLGVDIVHARVLVLGARPHGHMVGPARKRSLQHTAQPVDIFRAAKVFYNSRTLLGINELAECSGHEVVDSAAEFYVGPLNHFDLDHPQVLLRQSQSLQDFPQE
jgi:hypothetical protein